MDDAARRFEVDCRAVVELVTDHLDGVLDGDTAAAFDRHLHGCPTCRDYVLQIRATIAATGRLTREAVDLHTTATLVLAFRDLLATQDPPSRRSTP